MKKLVLLAAILISMNSFGQTHYCLSVDDICCDGNATTDVETTQQAYLDFFLYWDTGSLNNTVLIEISEAGTTLYSQNHCGCGLTEIPGANSGHNLTLKVTCMAGCNSASCTAVTSQVRVFSQTDGNPCKMTCD